MLYHIHELQHLALSPYRAWLHGCRVALAPWRSQPMVRPFAAGVELAERLTRRYGKPEFAIFEVDVPDGCDEHAPTTVRVREQVVDETPLCTLLHFAKDGVANQPKVLLVAPLVRPLRDAAARYRRSHAARTRRLHHRLDRRA